MTKALFKFYLYFITIFGTKARIIQSLLQFAQNIHKGLKL